VLSVGPHMLSFKRLIFLSDAEFSLKIAMNYSKNPTVLPKYCPKEMIKIGIKAIKKYI